MTDECITTIGIDEHVESARQLIAERKAQKEKELEQEEILKEKKRREDGKHIQESQKLMKETKQKIERQQVEKENKEDAEYQKKLEEQIRRDREERIAKMAQTEVTSQLVPIHGGSVSPRETLSDTTSLRVRLLTGEAVVESFPSTSTLGEVMKTLNEKHKITETYHFRMTFPNKLFTKADETETLLKLNLVPNAALVMTQANATVGVGSPRQANSTTQNNQQTLFQQSWNYVASWMYWFIGATPAIVTPPASTPNASAWGNRGKVNHIHSEKEYNEYRSHNELVIVDISATWCGPCKKIAPYYEQLSRQYPNVYFLHVDLDQFKHSLSDLIGISSVPTFLFFKGKKLVTTVKGANQQALAAAVARYQ